MPAARDEAKVGDLVAGHGAVEAPVQVIGIFVTVVDPPPIRNRRLVRLTRNSGMGKIVDNSLALVLLLAVLAVLLVGEA